MARILQHLPKIIVIVGPTASGKSAFAIEVAEQVGGEIICADSRTVYKYMDIGTAKPSQADRQRVPHHLLDVLEPNERFSAADFKGRATRLIQDIANRHKVPIIVGGTGLYIDSLLFDYDFGRPADSARRATLQRLTVEELQQLCKNNNIELPENSLNKRHLIRAIELGGVHRQNKKLRLHTLIVGMAVDSERLRQRIEARAAQFFDDGVINETRELAQKYGWESEAMKANIYKVLRNHIEGGVSKDDSLEECVRNDVALAKRQHTWFKRDPYIIWGEPSELLPKITAFLATAIS